MNKLDLRKADQQYYKSYSKPNLLSPKDYWYLRIHGNSAPEDPRFLAGISALYAVAYGIKFYFKSKGSDFVVPKLEGQWWVTGSLPFDQTPREEWHWNLLIPMPDFVTKTHFEEVKDQVMKRKDMESIDKISFGQINEGKSVQITHHGSYEEEGPTIKRILDYLETNGLEISGYHHEIYLTDPGKTKKEKLKTIIRYPIKPVEAAS